MQTRCRDASHLIRFPWGVILATAIIASSAQPQRVKVSSELDKWVESLQEPNADKRYQAAKALWESEGSVAPALPDLIRAMRDSEPGVRAYAALVLGRIGPQAKRAVPSLTLALKDPADFRVRAYSAIALGKIGPSAKSAIPELTSTLKDSDSFVRCKAAEALGRFGSSSRASTPQLIVLLDDDSNVKRCAAWALGEIGLGASEATPKLIAALSDPDAGVSVTSAESLGKIKSTRSIPSLIALLKTCNKSHKDVSDYERRFTGDPCDLAAIALEGIGAPSIPPLAELLNNDNSTQELSQRIVLSLTIISEQLEQKHDTSANPDLAKVLKIANEKFKYDYMERDLLPRFRRTVGGLTTIKAALSNSGPRPKGAVNSLGAILQEMEGLDVAGNTIDIAGQRLPASAVLTRGTDGHIRVNEQGSSTFAAGDGFYTAFMKETGQKFTLIKEEGILRLFRPFRNSYAILIAISNYREESGYKPLPQAVSQAQVLERVLRQQGFQVLDRLYDGLATAEGIRTALRKAPLGPEDRLFVYFGGHGDDIKGFDGRPIGYIVPYDADQRELDARGIPLQDLRGPISERLAAKQVLFALDSCQSGLALVRGEKERTEERLRALSDIEAMSRQAGRMFLTAGTGGQAAIDLNGGIFTKALIEAIEGKADSPPNGVTTFYEMYEYVRSTVSRRARSYGRQQDPGQECVLGRPGWVFINDRTLLP